MEVIVIMAAFGGLIVAGFWAMNKIDKWRRERSREKELPMDEED